MTIQYMTPPQFVAYRILSIGAKLLPVQPEGMVQDFIRRVKAEMRSRNEPVDEGVKLAHAFLKAAKRKSRKPEVRAYLAQQALRKAAWGEYRKRNPDAATRF